MERNPYYKAEYQVIETKPGMFCSRREAAGKLLLWLVISFGLLYLAKLAIDWALTHPNKTSQILVAGVFICAGSLFWSMAKSRARYGRGTRLLCGVCAVLAVLVGVFSSGVLR